MDHENECTAIGSSKAENMATAQRNWAISSIEPIAQGEAGVERIAREDQRYAWLNGVKAKDELRLVVTEQIRSNWKDLYILTITASPTRTYDDSSPFYLRDTPVDHSQLIAHTSGIAVLCNRVQPEIGPLMIRKKPPMATARGSSF